jgi:hypothetical protein
MLEQKSSDFFKKVSKSGSRVNHEMVTLNRARAASPYPSKFAQEIITLNEFRQSLETG